uniref:Uncharacterized protein n=1 Tax=virus sp. ctML55 TaxID=2827627 RepID=A0A8S5RIB5_9VIRU|nr:MAG TPA: hypothetical protein [virus sp. ctML55]
MSCFSGGFCYPSAIELSHFIENTTFLSLNSSSIVSRSFLFLIRLLMR